MQSQCGCGESLRAQVVRAQIAGLSLSFQILLEPNQAGTVGKRNGQERNAFQARLHPAISPLPMVKAVYGTAQNHPKLRFIGNHDAVVNLDWSQSAAVARIRLQPTRQWL